MKILAMKTLWAVSAATWIIGFVNQFGSGRRRIYNVTRNHPAHHYSHRITRWL
jgi:hypothetical protein